MHSCVFVFKHNQDRADGHVHFALALTIAPWLQDMLSSDSSPRWNLSSDDRSQRCVSKAAYWPSWVVAPTPAALVEGNGARTPKGGSDCCRMTLTATLWYWLGASIGRQGLTLQMRHVENSPAGRKLMVFPPLSLFPFLIALGKCHWDTSEPTLMDGGLRQIAAFFL